MERIGCRYFLRGCSWGGRKFYLSLVVLFLCVVGARAYDRLSAVEYIDANWNRINPDFHSYYEKGGDCANFGSQVLIAGGIRFRPYGPDPNDDEWFAREQGDPSIQVDNRGAINSAESLRQSLKKAYHGAVETFTLPEDLQPGDFVFLLGNNSLAFHTTIVRQIIDGRVYVASHNGDRSGEVDIDNWLEGPSMGGFPKAYLRIPDSPVVRHIVLTQGAEIRYQVYRKFTPLDAYVGLQDSQMIPEIDAQLTSGRIDARMLFDTSINVSVSPTLTYGLEAPFNHYAFGNWSNSQLDVPRDLWYGDIDNQAVSGNYKMSINAYGADLTRTDIDNDLAVYGAGSYAQLTFTVLGGMYSYNPALPPAPNIFSGTHPDPSQSYSNNSPTFDWDMPYDPSGIIGYSWAFDQNPLTVPDTLSDGYVYHAEYLSVAVGTRYFHLRAQGGDGDWSEAVHFRVNVIPPTDTTPPTNPAVTDDGLATGNPTQLHASWSSQDGESGITEYSYAVGTTMGGEDVVPYTSVGLNTAVTRTGLNLIKGQTYYFSVKAKNGVGLVSVGGSDGILCNNAAPVADAGVAYMTSLGTPITFDGRNALDPDGDSLTYKWDFGDGTVGDGVQPAHTYGVEGNYTVALVVNDGKVDSPSVSVAVTVSEFKGSAAVWTNESDFAGGQTTNSEIIPQSPSQPTDRSIALSLGPEKLIIDQPKSDRGFYSDFFYNACFGGLECLIRATFDQYLNITDGFLITKFSPLIQVQARGGWSLVYYARQSRIATFMGGWNWSRMLILRSPPSTQLHISTSHLQANTKCERGANIESLILNLRLAIRTQDTTCSHQLRLNHRMFCQIRSGISLVNRMTVGRILPTMLTGHLKFMASNTKLLGSISRRHLTQGILIQHGDHLLSLWISQSAQPYCISRKLVLTKKFGKLKNRLSQVL